MTYDPDFVWLIQENQDDRLAVLGVQDTLDRLGIRWIGVDIDFRSRNLPIIEGLKATDRPLCYGPSFIPRIDHTDPKWRIGCIFSPISFCWSKFRANWGELMLVPDSQVCTVCELRSQIFTVHMFIRPDADSKKFDGGVRNPQELNSLLAGLDCGLDVVVAPPVKIDAEYRVFIVDSEVIAASEYRRGGIPSTQGFVPGDVTELAIDADTLWRPERAYAIDVARSGSRIGIVEANCITAARFYAADGQAIVAALCRLYGRGLR